MNIRKEAEDFAMLCNIDEDERPRRKRMLPSRLDDSVVLATTGETSGSADSMYFKEIIDVIIAAMKTRFSDQNQEIMKAIQGLLPSSEHFFHIDILHQLVRVALASELVIAGK